MAIATTPWQNRIVGHGFEKASQLLAHPQNWRIHPMAQQQALGGVLDAIGWVQSVIVNQRTGYVLDGHLRAALAISNGDADVPVVYVDLDEEEELLILATVDPLAAMAVADRDQQQALQADILESGGVLANALRLLLEHDNPPPATVEAPDEFKQYDDDIPTDFTCPKCGYEWSGKPA